MRRQPPPIYLLVAMVIILLATSVSIHSLTHQASKKLGEAINNNEQAYMNSIPFFYFKRLRCRLHLKRWQRIT
jgi:hypothetical protein